MHYLITLAIYNNYHFLKYFFNLIITIFLIMLINYYNRIVEIKKETVFHNDFLFLLNQFEVESLFHSVKKSFNIFNIHYC